MKALFLVVATAIGIVACTLAPDHCITMSDCADGLTCNEGLCQMDPPDDTTLSADADTSSIGTDGGTSSSSTVDASSTAVDATVENSDASDADADADVADAPSDS